MEKKLKFLRNEISKIERLNKAIGNAPDKLLLENEALILNAIESNNNLISGGYFIDIWINNDLIEWSYSPATSEAVEREKNYLIENHYVVPLPNKKLYSINLNDVNWPETKRSLYIFTKLIIKKDKNNKKGIWLQGSSNSGKTFYSISLLNKFISDFDYKVSLINSSFINLIAENILKKSETSIEESINLLVNIDVLVFDSFDNSWFNKWVKENLLLPILELRLQKDKLTFFNSNITFDKYIQKLNFSSKDYDQELSINEKIISKIKKLINSEIKI